MKAILIAALLCYSAAFASEKVIVLYSKEQCLGCVAIRKQLEEIGVKWQAGSGDGTAGIQLYPTIVILVDGKEIGRIVGNKPKEELEKLLK